MADAPVLAVRDLHVAFAGTPAVAGLSLTVAPGEVVALVGESGAGKSVTALAVAGLLPAAASVTGEVVVGGRPVRPGRAADRVATVFQEPLTALNPTFRCGWQVAEALRADGVPRAERKAATGRLLARVGLDGPGWARRYPHELSGGQRQRVVLAIALARRPALLVADEPTTALDAAVQADVLDVLRTLVADTGAGLLLVTHDLGVVADLADRVVVLRDGRPVEEGTAGQVLRAPREPVTRALVAAVPRLPPVSRPPVATAELPAAELPAATVPPHEEPAVSVRGVVVRHRRTDAPALDGVDLDVPAGGVVSVVGESGAGKSTLARVVAGLERADEGCGHVLGTPLRARSRGAGRLGVVLQDPAASLDPRRTVGDSVVEPLTGGRAPLRRAAVADLRDRAAGLLRDVGLDPAWVDRSPRELSGGQRQRVALARALASRPALLVADEPTSALDVTVRARVLDLVLEARDRLGLAVLVVTHDLGVVARLGGAVVVLRAGRVVETGPADDVLAAPAHPWTRRLVEAVPVADPAEQRRRRIARAGR